jgi:hypothetical protein
MDRDDFAWYASQRTEHDKPLTGAGNRSERLNGLPRNHTLIGDELVDFTDEEALTAAGQRLLDLGLVKKGFVCCGRTITNLEMYAVRCAIQQSIAFQAERFCLAVDRWLISLGLLKELSDEPIGVNESGA